MKSFFVFLFLIGSAIALCGGVMTWMPGKSFEGPLAALTEEEEDCAGRLRAHVEAIGRDIGARGPHATDKLEEAGNYLSNRLTRSGFSVATFDYESRGRIACDLIAELGGSRNKDEVIVVGAHYDSPSRSPGAEDNASGCAVLLEIAAVIGRGVCDRTIRFVLFSNGAPPCAGGEGSGALAYALRAREGKEKILLMLSLDSLGIYRDTPGSQSCPFPLSTRYPDRGDFVAFLGDLGTRGHVVRCVETFRNGTRFPCEGAALPSWLPGMAESDAAAFRSVGFPAVLVTDTGALRYEHCGRMADTSDRLDYARMARVTAGLTRLVGVFAQKKIDLVH